LIGSLNYGNLTDNKGIEVGSAAHRRAWEAGQIDYYGRDSFDNIQQQLERNIQQNSSEYQPSQPRQISPDKTTTTTTGILKTSLKEVTPATQTTIHSQDVSKQSTTTTTNGSQHLSKESTNTLKSSLKGTTPVPQQQPTVVSSKQPTTPVPQQQSTVVSSKQPTTPVPQQQPTVVSSKEPTTVISQHVTKLPTTTNVSKQSTNPLKSSLKEPTQSSEESTTSVSQSILKESTSLLINPYKTSLTETTSYSQRENIQFVFN
jgi:hypothetical protein